MPFAKNEITRLEDREDKFARRIFVTSLADPRTRVSLEDFRLSRAYFFGLLQREGKDENGDLKMYSCLIMNKKGAICGQLCDPFGHGAFLCKATTRASDHNHARDIIESMGQAFDFVSSREVVIFPWQKKPDVELVDPRGEVLNILLDITLPALFQQSAASGEDVYKNARKAKAKDYPLRDSQGRRNNPSPCLPFILTSMGGLCSEGHAFLKICRQRNPDKADLMLDVLV